MIQHRHKTIDTNVDIVDDSGTKTEEDTSSNGNNTTRRPKIVNFSINNIIGHSYSIQLTTEIIKLIENLLELKQPKTIWAMTTVTPTPNV